MKTTFLKTSLIALALGLSLGSCKKDKDDSSSTLENQQLANDQIETVTSPEDISATVQQFMEENATEIGRIATGSDTVIHQRGIDNCATVTLIRSQHILIVDFGTTGCEGRNGRTRIGKWLIHYTQNWRTPGAIIDINFENFGFKRPNSQGFVMISNNSTKRITTLTAENGVYTFKKEVNLTHQLSAGGSRTIIGTRYVTWNTSQTADRYDDVITIDVTSTLGGTDRRGRNFEVAILEPIVIKTSCWLSHWYKPVSGVLQVIKIGKTKTINFGNGTCGDTFTCENEGDKQPTTMNEGD